MTILHLGGHTTLRLVAISTARRRHSSPKHATSPGSPTGPVAAGLTQHSSDPRSLLEVCIHAEETAVSTDLFPPTPDKFLNGTEGNGAGAFPSRRLNFVIPTLSNRLQTNFAALPALYCWKSIHGAISTRTVRPTEASHAPAVGINAERTFGEVVFN
jgi:hypothetical protein